MHKIFTFLTLFLTVISVSAQGTATSPEVLTPGNHTIPVNENDFRLTLYYSYNATGSDELLSLILPTASATVVASYTGGDPYQSEFPVYSIGDFGSDTTSFACYAPLGRTIYLKITIPIWGLPAGTDSVEVSVSATPCEANYGLNPEHPLVAREGEPLFLPLQVEDEGEYLQVPLYVGVSSDQDGWLFLNFEPSVTSIYYKVLSGDASDDKFTYLKHEYIVIDGITKGAKALLQVQKDETLLFEIKGFNGVMLTTAIEDPEPGTSCYFPLPVEEPGAIAIPDEPGDYYWAYTPEHEGYIELTSDIGLSGGYIEVMMDCQGWGSFTIFDTIWLRTWVYDRMEYLIHLHKEAESEAAEFELALTDPLPCDDADTAPDIAGGEAVLTPPFAGTYYYRIAAAELLARDMALHVASSGHDERTRVNLYDASDLYETIARGFDMTYRLEPETAYLLKWTVFDNNKSVNFDVILTDIPVPDSVENVTDSFTVRARRGLLSVAAENTEVSVFAIDGRKVFGTNVEGTSEISLESGVYIVCSGEKRIKVTVP